MNTLNSASSTWRKSTYSGGNGGSCVEVRFDHTVVRIRDSKYTGDPLHQPQIAVPSHIWAVFLGHVLHGTTAPSESEAPTIHYHTNGGADLKGGGSVVLAFTPAEWSAFTAGVRDGEFNTAEFAA
jgi:hypothetical protein